MYSEAVESVPISCLPAIPACQPCVLTDVGGFTPVRLGYAVLHVVVAIEEERLEGVKQEVSKILVDVRAQYSSIEVIYDSATIHHLETGKPLCLTRL